MSDMGQQRKLRPFTAMSVLPPESDQTADIELGPFRAIIGSGGNQPVLVRASCFSQRYNSGPLQKLSLKRSVRRRKRPILFATRLIQSCDAS
jgi:hypothetical protein